MARKLGDQGSVYQRLLKKMKINDTTGCWEWQGGKNNIGYGLIRDGDKMRSTHRVSYEMYKGLIPKGMNVCHECDNPICVNPDHLWLGTMKDNIRDMMNKGRSNWVGNRREKGWKHPIVTCEHCNKQLPINTYGRWHGPKCKVLQQSINTTSNAIDTSEN